MSAEEVMSPEPRAIIETFALAAALEPLPPEVDLPDTVRNAGRRLMDYEAGRAVRLSRDLAALLAQDLLPAAIVAGVMLRVSRAQVLVSHHPAQAGRTWERAVARRAGMLLAAEIAQLLDLNLPATHWSELDALLRRRHVPQHELARRTAAALRERAPVPLVVILTPLSQVPSPVEHARLLRVAESAAEEVTRCGMRCVVPGRLLSPDQTTELSPTRLYDSERRLLLRADVVILLAGPHDSWGAAQAITWCETNGASVLVFCDDPSRLSRVLKAGPYDTTIPCYGGPEDIIAEVVEYLASRQAEGHSHCRDMAETDRRCRSVLSRLRAAAREAARLAVPHGISAARLDRILSTSREADSMTMREARQLRHTLGAAADELIDDLCGRSSNARGREIVGESLDTLAQVVHEDGMTPAQMVTMLRNWVNAPPPQRSGAAMAYRTSITKNAWRALRGRGL